MDKKIKRKRLRGSLPVKIAIFILMILCVGVGVFAGYGTIFALSEDVYEKPLSDYRIKNEFYWQARQDQYNIWGLIDNDGCDRVDDYCHGRNIRVEIFIEGEDTAMWSNYEPEEDDGWADAFVYEYEDFLPITYTTYQEDVLSEDISEVRITTELNVAQEAAQEEVVEEKKVRIVLYVNKYLPYVDEYYHIRQIESWLYSYAYEIPVVAGVATMVTLLCFIFLMCSAGHRNELLTVDDEASVQDGTGTTTDSDETVAAGSYDADAPIVMERNRIYPGVLQGIWLDVLLALVIGILYVITLLAANVYSGYGIRSEIFWINGIAVTVWGMLTAFFGTLFCMELAIRIKRGGFLKHTLIYTVLRLTGRCIKAVVRGISAVFRSLPVLVPAFAAFAALSVCEFIGLLFWGEVELFVIWCFERVLLIAVICYFGLVRGKLIKAGRALAEGNLSYHVDTSKMILGYREHGNDLNNIGEGMAKAVSERMKSEHLKTELISNVSHDLKTPLTSIINYSDLLGQAETDPEKVKEYSEVLHRQSVRLKKLLDDLLEVSKASTGNLATDPTPCDINVLITQTIGEYEQRFAEKKLELILGESKQDAHIMADQRHLFRIFDNLLGNIYKYAQPGTRVYLNVENEDKKVRIIFRNMSEYPLNINGEELMERFVRGDKSRHKEGNGLGLSIAMSLAQLQGGSLKIITDGDLFKAVLEFPMQQG
ncbi:MAG: sensor histidine kinase [Lachnospiraceae bacterium]|nr:sensor histidine kinase [Lachnospiraceae bacterium]